MSALPCSHRKLFEHLRKGGLLFALFISQVITHVPCYSSEVDQDLGSARIKPCVLLFSGPPGSGRAKLIVRVHTTFSIPHISSADLVMEHIHDDTILGEMAREQSAKGCCFSDDFFFSALFERIGKGGCQGGFILDGIPRTLEQAESLYGKLSKTFDFLAFHIDVPDQWLIERVEGRLFCPECGRVCVEEKNESCTLPLCDTCKVSLQKRVDDDPQVILEKLKAYRAQMGPILQFYASKKILVLIKGDRSIEAMFDEISSIIEKRTGMKKSVICSQRHIR